MEIANENLKADMERWRVEKKVDLKRLLIKMADQHINYYREVNKICCFYLVNYNLFEINIVKIMNGCSENMKNY